MLAPKVLVTPRSLTVSPTDEIARLKAAGAEVVLGPAGRQPRPEELPPLLNGCAAWIAGVELVTGEIMATAPDLRLISRNGVGLDNVDLEAAARLGIEVRGTPGTNATGVAELAICLMLSGLRFIPWHAHVMSEGNWERKQGRELSSATVGVVGVGAIGGRVAMIAKAFGATVLAMDVNPPAVQDPPYTLVSLDELVHRADVVTLHAPATKAGPLLNATHIEALPRDTVLVNTARWSLVDHAAVLAALESGHLRAYAIDAYEVEPPEPSPLLRHPNVIATPHIGAFTAESGRRAAGACVDMVLDHLRSRGLVPA